MTDIILQDGRRTDLQIAYRSFDVGAYEAPVMTLAPADATTGAALVIETLHHTPTVTATGSVALVNGRILPGGNSPQTRVGDGIRQGVEWILAPAAGYLLRVTNTSGAAIACNVALEWYEETA